jgi:hypothetical protein
VNEKTVDAKTKSIAHLHREYANYRMRKGFDTKYFLR